MKASVQNTRHGQWPAKLQKDIRIYCSLLIKYVTCLYADGLEASVQKNLDMALQPARLHMLHETLEFILKNFWIKIYFWKHFFFRKQVRKFWNIFEKFLKIKQKENYLIWATRWTVSCPNSNNPRQRRQKLGANTMVHNFAQLTSKCTGSSK